MATAVYNRFDSSEDECGSEVETSTLVGSVYSSRSLSRMRWDFNRMRFFVSQKIIKFEHFSFVNSATSVEEEIYKCDGFKSDSGDETYDEDAYEKEQTDLIPQQSKSRKQLDMSPEAVQKRKEVFDKWLNSVK